MTAPSQSHSKTKQQQNEVGEGLKEGEGKLKGGGGNREDETSSIVDIWSTDDRLGRGSDFALALSEKRPREVKRVTEKSVAMSAS